MSRSNIRNSEYLLDSSNVGFRCADEQLLVSEGCEFF